MSILDDVPVLGRIIDLGYTMMVIILLSTVVGLILAFPVMWLWNFIFKNFASLQINVWQAWALNVLSGILLGNRTAGK